MNKNLRLIKRKNRTRNRLKLVAKNRARLTVFRSNNHIYAQIIDDSTSSTLVSASTLDKEIRVLKKSNCNIGLAKIVGQLIANRASDKSISDVYFDKGGYKYHGVVKALAEEARLKLNF